MADKVFHLDRFRTQWQDFLARKKHYNLEKKFLDEASELLKELSRGADEFQLGGQKVALVVAGQLNKTLLATEQPDIVKECTVTVTVERFSEDLFRQKYPDLYEQYRAKRLVVDPKIMGSIE